MLKNYKIPLVYQKMNDKGYLSQKNYLWLNEMEWMSIEKIRQYEYEEGENNCIIPFALTGGGDKWVWVYSDEKEEYNVGLCEHGETEGIYYAKNTEDAILRQIIEYISDSNFYILKLNAKTYQISEDELLKQLEKWESCFEGILSDNYLKIIGGFKKLKLKHVISKYGEWEALLSLEERQKMIDEYIDFDLLDDTFEWYL